MTGTGPEPPPRKSREPPPRKSREPPPRRSPEPPPPGAPTLCLGDALVELVCERPVETVSDADAFVPGLGGAVANVAVTAARHGAHVALAGVTGDDAWGRWLRNRLRRGGVETEWFELVPGARTPLAIVTVNREGQRSREVYGDRIAAALGDRLDDAVRGSAALYISSGGPEQNEVTKRARELALSLGRPVVFDPRICVERWRSRAEAAAVANACVPDALLVRAGAGEAALMTGEDDPERAALALLKAGARMVVITLGSEGAILRGELRLDVEGVSASAFGAVGAGEVGTGRVGVGGVGASHVGAGGVGAGGVGAGEVLTGILLARLATSAFYPAAVAASLPMAVTESARAHERWGALE